MSRSSFPMRRTMPWLALLAFVTACTTARHEASSLGTTNAAEILRTVRAHEDAIQSLRATFETSTYKAEELQRTADGVLLVRKPDAFRLRLTTLFGFTAFDYLSRGDGVHVVYPLAGRDDASPQPMLPFSEDDLREIFMRGDRAFPGKCAGEPTRDDQLVVDCREQPGALLRTIVIDARSGHILEERSYRDGELHLLLNNDDYRPVETHDLPYRILLAYPATRVQVEIRIHRYEVNPPLEERLFAPVAK